MENKKLNHETRLRISEKMKESLKEVSDKLEIKEKDLCRLLLAQTLHQIKSDALKNGWENIEVKIVNS